MIKLIASDLDGTLMSPDHLTVTPYTINTLEKAHKKGIKIAVATGRPLSLIDNVINQLPFVDYIIYSNGACVFDRKQKANIFSSLIAPSPALDLIEYFIKNKVFFEIYYEGKSYYQSDTEYLFDNTDFSKAFIDEVTATMTSCKTLLDFAKNKHIEKITLYSVKPQDSEKYKNKFLSYNMAVASSFKGNLEATAKNADKGSALNAICRKTGISAEECMTFGDAGNDIPMLKFAKYSFAMENGSEECKNAANYITASNADDGLAKAVESYAFGDEMEIFL